MLLCFYVSVIKRKSIILIINNVNKMLKEKTNSHPVIWFHYNQITNQCNTIELTFNRISKHSFQWNDSIEWCISLYPTDSHFNGFRAEHC